MLLAFADFHKALLVAVFLLLVFPTQAFIEISRLLPIITVQRAVLIVIFSVWALKMATKDRFSKVSIPFIPLMILFAVFSLFSVIFSVDLRVSFLGYLSGIIEYFLVYVIIVASVRDEEVINNILFVLVLAIGVIAIIGVIQKKTGWSPVDYLPPPSREVLYYRPGYLMSGRIAKPLSTTPHAIALGTMMAMAWPFTLVIACHARSILKRYIAWILLPLVWLCCYYALSRGPWLAALITLFIMALGSERIRRRLGLLIPMGILLISLRPGVIDTISRVVRASFDPTSPLGSSAWYRFELLGIGIRAISVNPLRTLFGNGIGTFSSLNLVGENVGKTISFWSCDSAYIRFLVDSGVLGLLCMVALLIAIILYVWKGYKLAEGSQKDILLALFSSIIAFIFMMTNANVYGWRQIGWLFWIILGLSVVSIQRNAHRTKESSLGKSNS